MPATQSMAVQPSDYGVFTAILATLKRFQKTDAANAQMLKIDSLPVLPRKQPKEDASDEMCEVEILFELEDENDILDLEVVNQSGTPVDVVVEPAGSSA